MTFKEIQDLIKLVSKNELTEFKLKEGSFELSIRTKEYQKFRGKAHDSGYMTVPQAVAMPQAAAPTTNQSAQNDGNIPDLPASQEKKAPTNVIEIKSPIVGTFYRSASPDKPAYAKVGDEIQVGDVVCIVEAMKLFNEIESEVSGKIVKVMVEDASPVEYDQVLFLVEPA